MRIAEKVGLMAMGLLLVTAPAEAGAAGTFVKPAANTARAVEYGKTLPPIGYVDFCGRAEEECKFKGGTNETLKLTTENWDQIQQVNRYVNTKIRPATDMELYHVPDYWTYPVDAGDCEDYALLKKRYLKDLGFNPDLMLMTVVLDENNEGHAVLTIPTSKGDYVLDNRRQEILRWDETGYTFLKRQSQPQANQWVSLQPTPAQPSAAQIPVGTRSN
ncbi:MAG: transglutaminase-like cysteine peptidase [Alphaproteobacteria bacterium]|nr:transglutaminase-like cysteine peptidase [Alphaproteobacteria bacterium]